MVPRTVIWLLLGAVSVARALKIVDTSSMAGAARRVNQQPHWSCIDGGADVESHWSAADEMLMVANAEDIWGSDLCLRVDRG